MSVGADSLRRRCRRRRRRRRRRSSGETARELRGASARPWLARTVWPEPWTACKRPRSHGGAPCNVRRATTAPSPYWLAGAATASWPPWRSWTCARAARAQLFSLNGGHSRAGRGKSPAETGQSPLLRNARPVHYSPRRPPGAGGVACRCVVRWLATSPRGAAEAKRGMQILVIFFGNLLGRAARKNSHRSNSSSSARAREHAQAGRPACARAAARQGG